MTQPSAPPQLSPDGLWWWNGAEWVPADQRPAPVMEQPVFSAPPVTPAFPTQPQGYGATPATPQVRRAEMSRDFTYLRPARSGG